MREKPQGQLHRPIAVIHTDFKEKFGIPRQSGLVEELKSTIVTLVRYPFDFTLRVIYALNGNKVEIVYQVENRSDRHMPFGIGGHPGFNVPLAAGKQFEEYQKHNQQKPFWMLQYRQKCIFLKSLGKRQRKNCSRYGSTRKLA